MCLIVVGVGASARHPLLVAANRDEQHARPTLPAAWWADAPQVLGGRDLTAGGTWLAVDDRGRFAAVTNVRDPQRPLALRSRGSLVADFLTDDLPAAQYAARVVQGGAAFGAFNLLLFDGEELHFASNRAAASETVAACQAVAKDSGQRFVAVGGNIGDAVERARIVAETLSEFGQIDALVNNAGIAPRTRADIVDATEESFDEVVGINLKGPYFLSQAVVRTWLARPDAARLPGGYKLIFVSSTPMSISSRRVPDALTSTAGKIRLSAS